MARRKKKSRRSRSFTLPLALVGGLAAGVVPPVLKMIHGNPQQGVYDLVENYTGFNIWEKKFNLNGLKNGLVPLFVGAMAHKAAGMLGLNQALGRAGVPIIRI